MQYLHETELSSLIMAIHSISQEMLPIVIIGAGLPQLIAKAGQAKSYAERLFDYPELGLKQRRRPIGFTNAGAKRRGCFYRGRLE